MIETGSKAREMPDVVNRRKSERCYASQVRANVPNWTIHDFVIRTRASVPLIILSIMARQFSSYITEAIMDFQDRVVLKLNDSVLDLLP